VNVDKKRTDSQIKILHYTLSSFAAFEFGRVVGALVGVVVSRSWLAWSHLLHGVAWSDALAHGHLLAAVLVRNRPWGNSSW